LLKESILSSNIENFSVCIMQSLHESIEYLKKNNDVDATLLDLTLPDSSGLETIRHVNRACPYMPIVVLTGIEDEEMGVESVRSGAQDYLIKGQADGRLISRAVRYAIERKQAEQELQNARDQLEERVKQRTIDLANTVFALKNEVQERINTTQKLKESEEKYRSLVEVTPEAICVAVDEKISFANTSTLKLLGAKSSEELAERSMWDFIHPDFTKKVRGDIRELLENKDKAPLREVKLIRLDGSILEIEASATSVVHQGKLGVLVIFHDITERKQVEKRILADQEQLRSLTTELILTEERERRAVAAALHDSLGPLLAFSKRELGILQKSAPAKLLGTLDNIRDYISQAIDQTRSLTFDLSPPALYTLGLEHAIEELTERFSEKGGIKCVFENSDTIIPPADDIKILLYRSMRELFVNITKHAQAKSVRVNLSMDGNNIKISVEDDGVGFNMTDIDPRTGKSSGFGLFSILQRLTQVGGQFDIKSEKGKGTKVILMAPLKSKKTRKGE
jgi:PAS domain S-box-containing protein